MAVSDTPPVDKVENPYESPGSLPRRRPVPRDILAICVLFTIVTVVGCAFIFSYWWLVGATAHGIVRSLGFAVMMAGLHFVGYRFWKRQQFLSAAKDGDLPDAANIWTQEVPRGLFWVVVFTLFLFLLFALRL